MKGTILVILSFGAGVLSGLKIPLPTWLTHPDLSMFVVYFLVLLVGVGLGSDKASFSIFQKKNLKLFLVPVIVVIGSLGGAFLITLFLDGISVKNGLAIGSGFGYYSLSSIYIAQASGETMGVIALVSNIFREIFTLLATPLLFRFFGHLAPIASGGATSMDTTLPVISKTVGHEHAILSVFNGTVLSLLVPVLVPAILSWY